MKTFKEICEEVNSVIPIKGYDETCRVRAFRIQLEAPSICFGCDKAKQFYDLVKKYNLSPIESIPCGMTAYLFKRGKY